MASLNAVNGIWSSRRSRMIVGLTLLLVTAPADLAASSLRRAKATTQRAAVPRRHLALHSAAFFGDKEEVEWLLSRPVDVDTKDAGGVTALMMAVTRNTTGSVEVAKLLIAKGADVDAADDQGRTALHWAAGTGDVGLVRLLIDAQADVNAIGPAGATPLHTAARTPHAAAAAEALLAAGAKVDAKDALGRTPLHWARLRGEKETADALLARGADVEAKDDAGKTPQAVVDEMKRPMAAKPKGDAGLLRALAWLGWQSVKSHFHGFAGHWEAELWAASPLRIKLDIASHDGRLTGTAEVAAWGDKRFSLQDIRFERDLIGSEVEFRLVGGPLGDHVFKGSLTPDGDLMGDYTIARRTHHLSLTRGVSNAKWPAAPAPPRQTPQAPFPYVEENVAFRSGDITLAGTLAIPKTNGPHVAIVLLNDEMVTDRDGSEAPGDQGVFFRVIADHFARAGLAVLRMDDRGVGGSGGDSETASLSDLADDAAAAVAFLRSRKEVAADRVGLVGFDQGAVVAPIAAARPIHAAFVVLLAADARPGIDVMEARQRWLLEDLKNDEDRAGRIAEQKKRLRLTTRVNALAKRGLDAEAIHRQMASWVNDDSSDKDMVESLIESAMTPSALALLRHDPKLFLAMLTMPVLALNGDADLMVKPDESLPIIKKESADAGAADVTVKRLEGYSHRFQKVRPDEHGGFEPLNQFELIDPAVLDIVTDWITRRFPSKPAG